MRLVVISHKTCWKIAGGYGTNGGFPFQMQAIAEHFSATRLLIMESKRAQRGLTPLVGKNLSVEPFPNIEASDLLRKLLLPFWLLRYLPKLVYRIWEADAVHCPVPSDLGLIGLLLALLLRKRLFVRHCGTWGYRGTLANRFLMALLLRIAGGKNLVLATGGGQEAPAPNVEWIFSTSLSQAEIERMPAPKTWQKGELLRLIAVGRLSKGKNTLAVIEALPEICAYYPHIRLDILGDGAEMPHLQERVAALGLNTFVNFHGNCSHEAVMAAFAEAHLLLFPTQTAEGFPKVVLEALASSVPVLAPPISVIPALLEDKRGILLKDTSAKSLAAAVLSIVDNPERLNAMAEAAQSSIKAYSLEAWGAQIAKRLEEQWHESLD